jgi:hypothetical protein
MDIRVSEDSALNMGIPARKEGILSIKAPPLRFTVEEGYFYTDGIRYPEKCRAERLTAFRPASVRQVMNMEENAAYSPYTL